MCSKLVIQYLMCGFRLVSSTRQTMISRGLPIFGRFLQTAEECCSRNICETCCKLVSLVKSNFDRYNIQTILLLYVCQISDSIFDVQFPTCQFYLSKCDIMRLPVFGSFCKLLGNVVTETFAEPSENLGSLVKSNFDRRFLYINVKLVIHYLMYGFRPVSSTC